MPTLERTTLIPGARPRKCSVLPGRRQFSEIFPERITPRGQVDPGDLRIEQGRVFHFRHWMFNCLPANWTVCIREVHDNAYFIDEMLKGPLRAFRHEHGCRPPRAARCTPTR
jgi:hypothetical protein